MPAKFLSVSASDLGSFLIDLPYVQGLSWQNVGLTLHLFCADCLQFYIPSFITCHARPAHYTPVVGICLQLTGHFMLFHLCAFAQAAAVCVYQAIMGMFFLLKPQGQISSLCVPDLHWVCVYYCVCHEKVFLFLNLSSLLHSELHQMRDLDLFLSR